MANFTNQLLNNYELDDIIEYSSADAEIDYLLSQNGDSQDPDEISRRITDILERKNLKPISENATNKLENQEETVKALAEEGAWLTFFKKFDSKYGFDHIPFQYCSLKQAINYSCLAPDEYRKLLILYLHNDNDKLSQLICPYFVKGPIRNVIETYFDILVWDLSSPTVDTLQLAIDEWPDLQPIKDCIKERRAGLFVIFPVDHTVTIIAKWDHGTVRLNDILQALLELGNITFYNESQDDHSAPEEENQIGSKEFQEMMFDRLGDRNYDSFESNQHNYLKDKIGFSKFGPPAVESGYDAKQQQAIETAYESIITQSNKYSEWKDHVVISFMYNCLEPLPSDKEERKKNYTDYNEYTDILPVPIYVIRKCFDSLRPCKIFIDHSNRVYESWQGYIEENKLHKCMMVVPKDGYYHSDTDDGPVKLETYYSPACGIGTAILQGTDIATSVVGVGAGGVFVLAAIPAITVAPIALGIAAVTGAGVGIYSLVRSSMTIHDRVTHCESMSFANSEARGAYLNLVAGSLGFVGMGATTAVSQLAARGVNIGLGARIALNTVNVINVSTGVVNIANTSYDIIDNWMENDTVSALSILQLSSSILFFGNAVYGFRSANTIVNEAQVNSIQNINDSLRSNRHRKTFSKFVKETVRMNDGNVQAARAEVISSIRNMSNMDETFAILTRNNKLFNKQGVRFSASNGEISLNGVIVDIGNLGGMSKSKTSLFLIDLPSMPKPTSENIQKTNNDIMNFIKTNVSIKNVSKASEYLKFILTGSTVQLFAHLLNDFSKIIREKIIQIFYALIDKASFRKIPLLEMCRNYCGSISTNPSVAILHLVLKFLKVQMNQYEEIYRKKFGNSKIYNTAKNAVYWFEKAVNIFVNGNIVNVHLLDELLKYIVSFLSTTILNNLTEREREVNRVRTANRQLLKCQKCCGKYYCN